MENNKISMVDLKKQHENIKAEIKSALEEVISNADFIDGPNVKLFEHEVQKYLNISHAITCASGTDALHLALRAINIKPGDEIITTAFSFASTAEAIKYTGAKIVFADIDIKTFNIDPASIHEMITEKTRAIIPVHLYGYPCDLSSIQKIIKDKNIRIVEDCAQSFGSSIAGKKTGTIGVVGCFSFYPSKNLGCYGDGGMMITSSDKVYNKLSALKNHGSTEKYQHDILGFNSRLDEIQAAVLRINLKHIDQYNNQRKNIAKLYNELLLNVGDIQTPVNDSNEHIYHQYTITSNKRNEIQQELARKDIATAIYYPNPLHKQVAFKNSTNNYSLKNTEIVCEKCLSLPMHPELEKNQVERVCDAIKQLF